ncbi:hypothetical protein BACCIP111895_01480 [Neobacillus rhizosphaerae]|uniref:YhcN/YlaJ family sporulation lipoprotein n=1 Tax=Neobacillus rhizosphaerae TaxID=2880965 RepID=A0ABM9ENX9_9BACI|nr:YhcN/YlaJ family sporulation lipoprotein [Neobacillus rhizosphaerae]CAH2714319.1 hypothetical protein BACCIP111895_01480 [Neobacillus rhizosphaerae]
MKKSLFITATLIFSFYLTGCARNNVNNDVATRNRNVTEPTRVNYQTPINGGPAITGVDVNDTGLDRNLNRRDNNKTDVGNNRNNTSKMRVADEAADRVADLPEVDRANIIVTDNNAYVAAKLDRSSRNELTSDIEKKISQKVKSVDKDIDNVYVSTNPDFYDRMNTYAGDIRNGKPISGFFNQFSETVRRIFPTAR